MPHKIFSVSELETFERCPHEYYLRYVLGLPSNNVLSPETGAIPANVRGSIVHAVIQRYSPAKGVNVSDLIMSECLAASVYPDEGTLADIKRLIATFEKSDLARHSDEGKRELRFDWRFENTMINGSIDWLKPEGNGFSVIDFKTDAITAKEVESRAGGYDLQLLTYALAVMEATGKEVGTTKLYFLEPDEIFTKPVDKKRAEDGRQRLRTIIASIREARFDIGDKEPPCKKCAYRHNGMCKVCGKDR